MSPRSGYAPRKDGSAILTTFNPLLSDLSTPRLKSWPGPYPVYRYRRRLLLRRISSRRRAKFLHKIESDRAGQRADNPEQANLWKNLEGITHRRLNLLDRSVQLKHSKAPDNLEQVRLRQEIIDVSAQADGSLQRCERGTAAPGRPPGAVGTAVSHHRVHSDARRSS